jgi:hypothetical protein
VAQRRRGGHEGCELPFGSTTPPPRGPTAAPTPSSPPPHAALPSNPKLMSFSTPSPDSPTLSDTLVKTVALLRPRRGFAIFCNGLEARVADVSISDKLTLRVTPFFRGTFWNSLSAVGRAMKGKLDISEGVNGYRDVFYRPAASPHRLLRMADLFPREVRDGKAVVDAALLPQLDHAAAAVPLPSADDTFETTLRRRKGGAVNVRKRARVSAAGAATDSATSSFAASPCSNSNLNLNSNSSAEESPKRLKTIPPSPPLTSFGAAVVSKPTPQRVANFAQPPDPPPHTSPPLLSIHQILAPRPVRPFVEDNVIIASRLNLAHNPRIAQGGVRFPNYQPFEMPTRSPPPFLHAPSPRWPPPAFQRRPQLQVRL